MTWKKYEFTDAKWAEMKAKIQKTFPDIEGGELTEYDPEKVTAVVEIGKLCTEWGTNEEGMQVCTKQAAKLSVDILWTDKPLTAMSNDHIAGAWTLNLVSALAAQIMPIVGVLSFCLTIGYTLYQWRKDVKKNNAEPKD
jgi:hypothetical protein